MLQVPRPRTKAVSTELLRGEPVATAVLEAVENRVDEFAARGVTPTLGTVLMSDDPVDERFVELKHETCEDVGIATRDVRLEPGAPADRLYEAVETLCADPAVDAAFVQVPLPDHVSLSAVRSKLDPAKDVDCFHPANLGRLVAGEPRFVPATPAAVCRLLEWYDVSVTGADVVIVGRSGPVGKPLANLLLRDEPGGNATVTVCHSQSAALASITRRADVLVTACGVPELVDSSMVSPDTVVVDVSVNRRSSTPAVGQPEPGEQPTPEPVDRTDHEVVGDVAFESTLEPASAITPVPGGVGPVTLAMLVRNVVDAAARRTNDA